MPRFGTKLDAATPGLSKLAAALGGGQQQYQQAFDQEAGAQSKLAQALSQIRMQDARANQDNAETGVLQGRPAQLDEAAALQSGSTLPMVQAVQQYVRTGQRPMRDLPGPADEAGVGPGQAPVVDDATQSRISQALQRMLPMRTNLKDTNVDDYAKATGLYRQQDLGDQVLSGQRTPGQVAAAQAAADGKPLYHFDSSGLVGDLFGGGLNESSGRAQAVTGKESALGKQATAGAAENYAQAEAARASAEKHRADIREVGAAGGRAPTGYRWAPGGALEPIPGGPADPATRGAKLAKPPTEGQAKALMFGSRMAVADEILSELAKGGEDQPGRIKQGVEQIPFIGGALGAGVNMLPGALGGPNDQQQQVEQAQRDFINAVLRRESGAAIADSEFKNARLQYFDQPGDSPAVRRQKAANRKTAISGFKAEFGDQSMPQFDQILGEARTNRRAPEAPAAAMPPAPAANGGRPPLSSFNR